MATQGALHHPPVVLESLTNFTADLGTLRTTDAVQERQAKVQEAARRLMQDESVRNQAYEIGARGKAAGVGGMEGAQPTGYCVPVARHGTPGHLLQTLCPVARGGMVVATYPDPLVSYRSTTSRVSLPPRAVPACRWC